MAETKILEIKIEANEYIKVAQQIKTEISAVSKLQDDMKKSSNTLSAEYIQNSVTLKELNAQYRFAEKQIQNYNESVKQTADWTAKIDSVLSKEAKTVNELTQQNAELNKIKNNLNIKDKEHLLLIEKINNKQNENTKAIKETHNEDQKRISNIGNYEKALSTLSPRYSQMIDELEEIKSGLEALKNGLIISSGATNRATTSTGFLSGAMKILKIALISTGIGAIVVALGSLIAYLSTTQAGIDAVTTVTRPLQAIMSALLGIVQKIGNAFAMIITGDVINGFKQLGSTITNIGSDLKNAAKAGSDIDKTTKDLEKSTLAYKKAQMEVNDELDKQSLIAKDTSLSMKEREAASKRIIAINKENGAAEAALIQKEIDILAKKQSLNDTGRKGEEEMLELQIKLDDAKDKGIAAELDQMKIISGYKKEQAQKSMEQAKAVRDNNIKNANEEFNIFLANEKGKQTSLDLRLKYEENLQIEKLKLLEVEHLNGAKSEKEYYTEKLTIQNEYIENSKQLSIEKASKELELWKLQNSELLNSKNEMTNAIYSAEKAIQDELYEKRKSIIEQEITDELEKNIALENLKLEHNISITAINDEWESINKEKEIARRENEKIDYDIKLEEMMLRDATEAEILQLKYDNEKLILDQNLADKKLSQEQYNKSLKNLDDEKTANEVKNAEILHDQKSKLASNTFGNISELLGKETAAGKAAAIAQATMNTYQGVTEVWRTKSVLPEPLATAIKVISTGVVLASGLKAVKQITSTPVKFSRGGLLIGKSHKQGGVPMTVNGVGGYEAEGGEAVINRASTAMFAPLLSEINAAGGGRKFSSGGLLGATDSSLNTLDVTNLFKELRIVNIVEETEAVLSEKTRIQNRANL